MDLRHTAGDYQEIMSTLFSHYPTTEDFRRTRSDRNIKNIFIRWFRKQPRKDTMNLTHLTGNYREIESALSYGFFPKAEKDINEKNIKVVTKTGKNKKQDENKVKLYPGIQKLFKNGDRA